MGLSGPLIEVVKGSRGFIVGVNKENVDEFSVNFGNVDDIDVVRVFRKEFDIINKCYITYAQSLLYYGI